MIKQEFLKNVPIDRLELWDSNFRDIKPDAFSRLKNKIKELGVFKPLLAVPAADGKYSVIGGNQRLKAYRELGYATADIILYPELTDKKIITKIAIADNQSDGDTDLEKLHNLIIELKIPEVELEDYSVSAKSISVSCAVADFSGDAEEDTAPEADNVNPPKTQRGDIWLLGGHRLMCGSSADANDFTKLTAGQKARLIFTDPPYNVDYKSPGGVSYDSKKFGGTGNKIFNDNLSDKDCISFYGDVLKNLYAHSDDNATIYWWHASRKYPLSAEAFKLAGWHISQVLIWLKNSPIMARGQDYHRCYEPCIVGWKAGQNHYRNAQINNYKEVVSLDKDDFADVLDVWYERRDNVANYVHPTQKPVALAKRALRRSSKADDVVLDGFGGSGSTLIACDQLGRKCLAMELDPKYCDVIAKRYAQVKGGDSDVFLLTADGSKKTFGEIFGGK